MIASAIIFLPTPVSCILSILPENAAVKESMKKLCLWGTGYFPNHTMLLKYFSFYERKIMQDYSFNEYFDRFPLAMAYVPWQHLTNVFENLDEGYKAGTIFPELEKPFTGRRCVK